MEQNALREFLYRHERLLILTGAGCSTDSGIPDYRDREGGWKRAPPVMFRAFMDEPATRQRYWARSLVGWSRFGGALPNDAHHALAQLEREDRIELLVTQNVDRLHQAAGSSDVLDLHGRLDLVRCMQCAHQMPRDEMQTALLRHNGDWAHLDGRAAPDGDADIEAADFSAFHVPECSRCGGVLKPEVVFFGESVPADRVARAMRSLEHSDAVLVVGSSLMVYSGYRFVLAAAQSGKPVAAINLGRTRADGLLTLKVVESCATALSFLLGKSPSAAAHAN